VIFRLAYLTRVKPDVRIRMLGRRVSKGER
jgi:hypothetical protein